MEKDEIYRRICEVVSDVLGVTEQDITPEARFVEDLGAESIQSVELVAAFEDLGAESIQSVELVAAFEEEFDIEMDEEAALQVSTVGSAVDFIAEVIENG
jgi:acyl carrier protein